MRKAIEIRTPFKPVRGIEWGTTRWLSVGSSIVTAPVCNTMPDNRHREQGALQELVEGNTANPFHLLGIHAAHREGTGGYIVRAFLPHAREVSVCRTDQLIPMKRVHDEGLFEAFFPNTERPFPYTFQITDYEENRTVLEDPYRFGRVLTDFDLHLFREGKHYQLYAKLGAHRITHQGIRGVSFAVWAPNAARVSVIGDFNRWDERCHPMRSLGSTGLWEIFLPGLGVGRLYKYHIKTRYQGASTVKADPYGFAMEKRPETASIVWDLRRYQWRDEEWMAGRGALQGRDSPLSIYEVHLGSWKRSNGEWLSYEAIASELIPYAREMGFTHIQLMPVSEHPFDGSWGYQTVGYFAPTSRFGSPDDFRRLVDRAHRAGIGIILDWVPAHFPKDGHGLGFFDGTHLYEHADPRKGLHPDWDTLIYNYGRREVGAFLLTNALFWLDEYHIDGLRVDAVASMLYLDYSRKDGEWEPNREGGRENREAEEFLKRFNGIVHKVFPDVITIAEESTSWPLVSRPLDQGGLGFDFKWNMGWMNDMLEFMSVDPLYRGYHLNKLTFSLLYAYSENFILPLSHDEVVHGKGSLINKMPGDRWQMFANLRTLYAYMFAHPGRATLFMGGEFAQRFEWDHDWELQWYLLEDESHRGMQRLIGDLNRVYRSERALHELDFHSRGFEWIEFEDRDNCVVSFLRRGSHRFDPVVVVANFTPVVRETYKVGVPEEGRYEQLLNTDSKRYGGNDVGVVPHVDAAAEEASGREWSIELTLPPLGVLYFRLQRRPAE